ncbi:MAG TPA: YcxB family protein [Ramlibacter sp.]|uniref:YcxB family protein n=1 Tax=Ramlibacter sp. TaxID=1917967 RepID=UPI002ED27717
MSARFTPPAVPVAETSFRDGMRLEYRLTYADMLLFAAAHQFFSPLLQLMFLGLAALIAGSGGDNATSTAFAACGWYAGLWLAQFALIAAFLVSRKNRTHLTTHAIEVSDRSLYEATRYNESHFFWPGVIKAVSRPGFVAVYVAQHTAHVIPDRAFASPEQRSEFLAVVRRKIAGAA